MISRGVELTRLGPDLVRVVFVPGPEREPGLEPRPRAVPENPSREHWTGRNIRWHDRLALLGNRLVRERLDWAEEHRGQPVPVLEETPLVCGKRPVPGVALGVPAEADPAGDGADLVGPVVPGEADRGEVEGPGTRDRTGPTRVRPVSAANGFAAGPGSAARCPLIGVIDAEQARRPPEPRRERRGRLGPHDAGAWGYVRSSFI